MIPDVSGSAFRLACLLVALAAVLTHAGSLDGGFVHDDHRSIEANPHIRSVRPWAALTDASTEAHGEGGSHVRYRPLRTVLFSVEYALFADPGARAGAAPASVDFRLPLWHWMSVLLHALNAVLLLRLLLPLLRAALLPAVAGALLFALHPLTSESVAWLTSQGDLLAVTLSLTALILLERRGLLRSVLGALSFAGACLANESALMLPLLLVLRDFALPRDAESRPSPWSTATWRRAGLLAGFAAFYFALRLNAVEGLVPLGHPPGGLPAVVRGMLHGLVWYAGGLLWPTGFSFDAHIDIPFSWTDPIVWVGAGLLGSTVATGVWALRRGRGVLAFATLGVLVALLPFTHVLLPLEVFVADRFLYPGLICVAAGLGALLYHLRGRIAQAGLALTLLVLCGLAALTSARNDSWTDDLSLWKAVLRNQPSSAKAYEGLAFEYARQRRAGPAVRAYATYIETNPYDGRSLRTLGDLLGQVAEGVHSEPTATKESGQEAPLRRADVRKNQIQLYERALRIWSTRGGLETGRGSIRMRAEMLERWIEAGLDIAADGDSRGLWHAKYANDQLIDLEAGERRHDDAEAVMQHASWLRRRVRYAVLLAAVRLRKKGDLTAAERKRVDAARDQLVRDVRLDPARTDQTLLPDVAIRLGALIDEGLRRRDVRPDRWLFLDHAGLLVAGGRYAAARRALLRGLEVYRGDPTLSSELSHLENLLRERGGR